MRQQAWDVEFTAEFEEWFDLLSAEQQGAVDELVQMLIQDGPRLDRPHVGLILGSRHPHMKELICRKVGELRILFIFDPRRTAILLVGGDKAGEWNEWYERMIPIADAVYDQYLSELGAEGLLPP